MTSTDPEGTDKTGYRPISEGTIGEQAVSIPDLENGEVDKLEVLVSEALRGNLHCGSEFPSDSCKSGQRLVQAWTPAFRVRSTWNEPPRPCVLAFIRALADKLDLSSACVQPVA